MAKAMGLFRDSWVPSWLSGPRTDVSTEPPSHRHWVIPKTIQPGMYCSSAKHAALRRKSKDWLSSNQYNVSEWRDIIMSSRGLLL